MATKYRATVSIKCWKEHECVGCGGVYRYKFARTVTGTASSERGAEQAAERAAEKSVRRDVDQRPCPRCGCLQPDMIGQRKARGHLWVSLVLLALLGTVAVFGLLPDATSITYSTAATILAVLSVVGLLVHAPIALLNPNRDMEANRRRAEGLVDRGVVEPVAEADDELIAGQPRVRSRAAVPLLAIGLLGAVATVPVVVLKAVGGWPVNAGTKPEVVGPGDTVRVYFPDRISTVKGYWNGTPRATFTSADGSPPRSVSAKASTTTWGTTISGKSVSSSNANLWADVTLPSDPALAGKTVGVSVDMTVNYPKEVGRGFEDATAEVHTTHQYTLAAPGTADGYLRAYWLAVGGAAVFAASGFGLWLAASGLRKYAAPASVTPIGGGSRRDRDEDEDDDRSSHRGRQRDDRGPRRARRVRDDDDDRPRRRRDDEGDYDDRRRRED